MWCKGHFTLELEGPWHVTCTNYAIDWEAENGPSSLYIRPWGPKGPKKFEWMKKWHGVLHDIKWIMFHGLSYNCIRLFKIFFQCRTKCNDKQSNYHGLQKYTIAMFWSWTTYYFRLFIKYVAVHHHSPLPLLIRHKGPSIATLDIYLHSTAFGWFSSALRFSWSRPLVRT